MPKLSKNEEECISMALIKKFKKKINKNDEELISPVKRSQLLQTKAYNQILDIGTVLNDKYFKDVKNNLNDIFKEKREIIIKRIQEQHVKNLECLLFDLKTKYEIKLSEFINDMKERFNEYLININMEVKSKCEEKIKQLVVDIEKRATINLNKLITATEKYLNLEFEYVEEQNLSEYKEYYLQLTMYYELKFKNNLDNMKKEHEENYKTVKNRIMVKHKNDFDSVKIKLQNKLQAQRVEVIPKLSVIHDGDEKRKKRECFEKQKADKYEELIWSNQQLEYFKEKIKSVLNNYYSNATTFLEKQRFGYVLDKEKIFQKYLQQCRPTEIELEQSIQDTE